VDRASAIALKLELTADLAQALSNPVRLRILGALGQRQMAVDDLARRLGQSRGNTSAQLRALAQAGLVQASREGRQVFYRLSDPSVAALVTALHEAARRVSPSFRALVEATLGEVVPLDAERARELLARISRGEARLVDVRSRADHEAAHLAGALSFPLAELESRGPQALGVPGDVPLVVHCRDRFCLEAEAAARRLRASGFRASNLYASVVEAEALGWPTVRRGRAPAAPPS
jgi:DNA-binding transcriptional ArsR family regulator/rhodanese-related sulfurtransferase